MSIENPTLPATAGLAHFRHFTRHTYGGFSSLLTNEYQESSYLRAYNPLCLLSSVFCLLPSVFCPLSSVLCPLSSVFCPLSSVLCLLSSVLCLLSSVFCPLSSVLCLLPSVFCPLSSVLCLLSSTSVENALQINPFYAKQTQSCPP